MTVPRPSGVARRARALLSQRFTSTCRMAVAATAIRTALHLLPNAMPRINSISMDATVGAFAISKLKGTQLL